jgi:hypothetical protein
MITTKLIKFRLSTSAALPINAKSETKDFKPGIHELPEEVMGHWFVQGLIKQGSIVIQGSRIEKEERKPIVVAPIPVKEEPKEEKKKETIFVGGASIPDSQKPFVKVSEPVKVEENPAENIVEEITPEPQEDSTKIKRRGRKGKK